MPGPSLLPGAPHIYQKVFALYSCSTGSTLDLQAVPGPWAVLRELFHMLGGG
jgi:hypothetical protein